MSRIESRIELSARLTHWRKACSRLKDAVEARERASAEEMEATGLRNLAEAALLESLRAAGYSGSKAFRVLDLAVWPGRDSLCWVGLDETEADVESNPKGGDS